MTKAATTALRSRSKTERETTQRRPRRSAEETRRDILAMTEKLFRERGFGAVAIADIAAELGMSPANVFKHFHSKSVLVDAIAVNEIRKLELGLHSLDNFHPPFERLHHLARTLMQNHRRSLEENPYIFEMILMTAQQELECSRYYEHVITAKLTRIIEDGISSGIYAPHIRPTHAADVALQALASVIHPVLVAYETEDKLATRCEDLVRMIDAALRNKLAK